ncbi:ADP-ribosylglycohydrolase family protein [Anaerobium acetethylicum]|uniref:ADP-ribosylglycohydrolase n=1 Tax=Anaerobium acetethylicum TaxID=1619234 RepID=A0A1D3TTD8_9FIRM|nr:ADP-ribosylglycohydrolase family protein [Anaerobium acetethylicum]SCP97249.1 ADP-ribosylglycohydrolase [Anaerobium acetethylicum]
MSVLEYREQIYAGVLGKLIGVYLGRPIEGWSYEKITEEFGDIKYYVHEKLGLPLIVADDDISGTFGFFRALEDNGYKNITAKDFGNTWLNYIIEDKTILWWGGLGRSTEHTAFLNLKNGIDAPMSGSVEQNGKTLAEQIGAQIFIDAIAMACPNNPDMAVDLVRKAASVSHGGLALDAACHLAALEAMAFEEKDIDVLLDRAQKYIKNEELIRIIADVRRICSEEKDWRRVRDYLNPKYGYDVYPGCCHMVPNHAMVIASIILGGDDFQKSISIATSAAWDTDCNAGNVGAFNGIRLGLDGIDAGADFRTPVSDLMYVVASDGGSVVTDAVTEADRILKAAAELSDEEITIPTGKYTFAYRGSTQGFAICEYEGGSQNTVSIRNGNEDGGMNGLAIKCSQLAAGVTGNISTPTFIDMNRLQANFSTIASPTLYSSQIVKTRIKKSDDSEVFMRKYILYYDINNDVQALYSDYKELKAGMNSLEWKVPDTGGMAIFKLGYEVSCRRRYDGELVILDIDWKGAPSDFAQKGMLMTSIWNTNPFWIRSFASSAKQFAADFKRTYCISHVEADGLVTIGSREWDDYSVSSTLYFSLHKNGGLVLRSRGHKRYYGAVLSEFREAVIYRKKDRETTILARVPYKYQEDEGYEAVFKAEGDRLEFYVNGSLAVSTQDSEYRSGGAGFVISEGTMTADSLIIS